MALRKPWRRKGWRRTALINIIGVLTSMITLVVLLGITCAKSGGININWVFFSGDCNTSSRINLLLHLVLNIFSTLIIASSNFFMQILNAPSRKEVNEAHRKLSALEIGVPSLKNIVHIDGRKSYCWFLLMLSSVPIHLVFNSAVFETEYQGSQWRISIAAAGFANGAEYFPPGAPLWPAGGAPRYQNRTDDLLDMDGYGKAVNLTDYFEPNSSVVQEIQRTAQSADGWKRLEVDDCITQYQRCSPKIELQDVILVVQSRNVSFMNNTSLGWTRSGLLSSMNATQRQFWDPHVPADGTNSLWFSSQCSTVADLSPRTYQMSGCYQSCHRLWGSTNRHVDLDVQNTPVPSPMVLDFAGDLAKYSLPSIQSPGFRSPDMSFLQLQYCLAQPVQRECKVGLAPNLLLAVTICLAAKLILCILLLRGLRDDPLVTPGDAIASFLTAPDHTTLSCCALDTTTWGTSPEDLIRGKNMPGVPHVWTTRTRRWLQVISGWVWVRSYILFIAAIVFTGGMLGNALHTQSLSRGSFFQRDQMNGILTPNGGSGGLLGSVLLANSPQLLLSFSYFAYNALHTRLQAEREWHSYCREYKPLRVTQPEGEQVSSYRLQLPYRYSLPLISVSIVLHWLVSNALYMFVMEGGYYSAFSEQSISSSELESYYQNFKTETPGLNKDAFIGIGFSALAILAVLVVACVLVIVPLLLSSQKMKGDMVIGGTNSMVISAACHASLIAAKGSPRPSSEDQAFLEVQNLEHVDSQLVGTKLDSAGEVWLSEHAKAYLLRLSRRPLRWGAVPMPAEFAQGYNDMDVAMGHLSFGTEDQGVSPPVAGRWYA